MNVGISAEAGIPTFRGPGGLWERFDPSEYATPEAFRRDPRKVWSWYRWRMELAFRARPTRAHLILAQWEREGLLRGLVTQNVDGLHREAGSVRVVEIHGSMRRVRCTSCPYREELTSPPEEVPPRCPECGSLLRPDVVWFGEPIPRRAWEEALEIFEGARTALVVGTSASVYPAASLPLLAAEGGAAVVEVNPGETPLSRAASVRIPLGASEALELIERARRR
ncbi:MAG: NAD-dependent protein deacylase [Thermoproteota archaeon]|nr:MAG: NAD-dependent protein deacylase [Candidatus Korarchaeota archaeon]